MRPWLAGLLLCSASAVAAGPSAPDLAQLREGTRLTLKRTCGDCHDSRINARMAGALRVFDTREDDWSARMTAKQLSDVSQKISRKVRPTRKSEVLDSFVATAAEAAELDAFIRAEEARRAGAAARGTP